MNELVSVVIPTYNYAHFLCGAVDSALAQTYKNIEVIVVDDGSADNTSDVVKKYDGKIKYIFQKNRGLSSARNTGIREAKGTYVAILDADDIWSINKISEQVKFFEEQVNVGAVSCRFYEVNESGVIIRETKQVDCLPKELQQKLTLGNVVSGGSSLVVRKECFDAVGLFDENLRSAEDWDMWLRISRKYIIRIIEKPLLKVRVGNYNMSSSGNAQKMLDNELVVLNKYFGNTFSLLKAKAMSQRYFSAAWAFSLQRKNKEAFISICRCFLFYPMALFQKNKLGLCIKIINDYKFGRGVK